MLKFDSKKKGDTNPQKPTQLHSYTRAQVGKNQKTSKRIDSRLSRQNKMPAQPNNLSLSISTLHSDFFLSLLSFGSSSRHIPEQQLQVVLSTNYTKQNTSQDFRRYSSLPLLFYQEQKKKTILPKEENQPYFFFFSIFFFYPPKHLPFYTRF